MPFEPLQTDEKLDQPATQGPDFEGQMLFGCTQFVVNSLATYGLATWPHYVFPGIHTLAGFGWNALIGLAPTLLFGGLGTRRFGLAAAAGFLGGSLATAIFLFLRLQQIHVTSALRDAPKPEWPRQWVWMAPVAYLLLTVLAIAVSLRREELAWSD